MAAMGLKAWKSSNWLKTYLKMVGLAHASCRSLASASMPLNAPVLSPSSVLCTSPSMRSTPHASGTSDEPLPQIRLVSTGSPKSVGACQSSSSAAAPESSMRATRPKSPALPFPLSPACSCSPCASTAASAASAASWPRTPAIAASSSATSSGSSSSTRVTAIFELFPVVCK